MGFVFFAVVIVVIALILLGDHRRRRKLASMRTVEPHVKYPNNHHVLGVGYYHAASQMWYPHPWNEYREDRGYYWNGAWNHTPDQRMVADSIPTVSEVDRVNAEWRRADPDRAMKFWAAVEREGFGTAIRRSEGS